MSKLKIQNKKSSLSIFRVNQRYGMDDHIASQINSGIEILAVMTEKLFDTIDSEIPQNKRNIRIRIAKVKMVDALNRLSTIGAIELRDFY